MKARVLVEAIWQGCILRFRPIMMTTVAALFGTLPIALAYGEGADARQPLGLAVVGGLLVSQFLTLYITPVIYLYLEKCRICCVAAAAVRSRRSNPSRYRPGRNAWQNRLCRPPCGYATCGRRTRTSSLSTVSTWMSNRRMLRTARAEWRRKTTTIEICEGLTAPDSGDSGGPGMRWKDRRQAAASDGSAFSCRKRSSQKSDGASRHTLFRSFFQQGPRHWKRSPCPTRREAELAGDRPLWRSKAAARCWPARSSAIRICCFWMNQPPGSIPRRDGNSGSSSAILRRRQDDSAHDALHG